MNKLGVACIPLVENVPKPKSEAWTKTTCPVCGRECWESKQFKWAKQIGIINEVACTKCALKAAQRKEKEHDGSFSNCDACNDCTCDDGWCSWDD